MDRAVMVGMLVCWLAAPAEAQTYTVSVAESGVAYPTQYSKRYNWRYYGELRHTTGVASTTDPLACAESPCLDDGEPGDRPPDGTRGGIASGSIGAMSPGQYLIELKSRRSVNRATSVPWGVVTDAASNNQLQGSVDLRNDPAISDDPWGSWFVAAGSTEIRVNVASSLTFFFGTDSGLNGSLSYGGLRATRVCDLAGVCSPGETEEQACGNCGTMTRICGAGCQWGAWSTCGAAGVCAAGAVQPCGVCGGSQTCSATCEWGPCVEVCVETDAGQALLDGPTGGDASGPAVDALEDGGAAPPDDHVRGGCSCGLAGRHAPREAARLVFCISLLGLGSRRRSLVRRRRLRISTSEL